MKFLMTMGSLAVALAVGGTAHAEELTGTLKKIKDTGVITLGARDSSPPFSYSVENGKYTGYSYEIMLKVADKIKAQLKMPNLQERIVPFTAQNRIPMIVNGSIDLECTSTTNNLERQQQVSFSTSIFVIGTRLLTGNGSGIKDFADLKGKNVATTAGTTSERLLTKMNDEQKMGFNVLAARENSQAFLSVEGGRAVAYMMDDAILYGERAKAKDPSKWTVVGTPASHESYGCMMKKDDSQLKQLVDSTIIEMMKSGEMQKLYEKWFVQPIPPRNVALNFPLSDDMKALYANPNDKALQ
ncbi:amino acid ABC transporter substrate-binding protein [Achromobacter sp. HZ28]|jgi:glutamate/aspartate transport system substrate-binding protein|nr:MULTISPECIES: glutamate/aspartate ABC transporter substrate-binding protein [unclassified Achromobacter]OWT74308.1 amino acid ABC transporter substrate-binding protein [Achromobacter sp. HZ34]OWT78775.1 amino acid ABC transporter substrate-binding protein [Achromobacter sp. HZ28]